MGFNLCSPEGVLTLDNFEWAMLRTFGEANGWIPQGTRAPDPSIWPEEFLKRAPKPWQKWNGRYDCSEFQEVSSEDASNMADALRAGIESIKDGKHDSDLMGLFFPEEIKEFFEEIPPSDVVRHHIIRLCEEFFEICEGGPFLIGWLRA